MKAIAICQPYAEMIARGTRLVVNRTWYTDYRGTLAIHAGRSRGWFDGADESQDIRAADCQFGAIIAVADLYACLHISHFQMGGYLRAIPAQIPFARGPYCWLLRKVVRVKPFPVRGQQGLFDCPFTLQYLPTNPGAPGNNPTKLRRVLKEMIR